MRDQCMFFLWISAETVHGIDKVYFYYRKCSWFSVYLYDLFEVNHKPLQFHKYRNVRSSFYNRSVSISFLVLYLTFQLYVQSTYKTFTRFCLIIKSSWEANVPLHTLKARTFYIYTLLKPNNTKNVPPKGSRKKVLF